MYYTARLQVSFENDKGQTKKRTEQYLVNAESVTEVESIVNTEFRNYKHDFEVKSISESRVIDVLTSKK